MRKLLIGLFFTCFALALAGCAVKQQDAGYHYAGVKIRLSSALLLYPSHASSNDKVYIHVLSQLKQPVLSNLQAALIKQLQAQHFTVVSKASEANYSLIIKLRRVGVMNENAVNSVLLQAYDGGINSAGQEVLGKKMFDKLVAKSPEQLAVIADVEVAKDGHYQHARMVCTYQSRLPTAFKTVEPNFVRAISRLFGSIF